MAVINGGFYSEEIYGSTSGDTISGWDPAIGDTNSLDDDTIYAWDGNDSVRGGDGMDELFGESGNDTLSGGLGDDLIGGGLGNDTAHPTRACPNRLDCSSRSSSPTSCRSSRSPASASCWPAIPAWTRARCPA